MLENMTPTTDKQGMHFELEDFKPTGIKQGIIAAFFLIFAIDSLIKLKPLSVIIFLVGAVNLTRACPKLLRNLNVPEIGIFIIRFALLIAAAMNKAAWNL